MKRLVILAMILAAGCVGGCETSRGARGGDGEEQAKISSVELAQGRLREVHEVRQRRVDEALGVEIGEPAQVAGRGVPQEVAEEWRLLGEILFPGAELSLKAQSGQVVERARFDRAEGKVVVDGEELADGKGAFAFDLAVNQGLEALAFEELEDAATVDGWIAKEIARLSGPAFVSALLAARRAGFELSAQEFAGRPELSLSVPVVNELLSGDERLPQLILREAIVLGAALYRAGGWPAVEWGRIEAPQSSDYAVRPDRWLKGDGEGVWRWDESEGLEKVGWEEVAEGKVGPALIALWLEAIVGAPAARTVFQGWLSDSYRIYQDQEEGQRFLWVSAWNTPYEAQEVGEAIAGALQYYGYPPEKFIVEVEGIHVGVVAYKTGSEVQGLEEEVARVRGAKFGIMPDSPAPIRFIPTYYEHYSEIAGRSTLEGDIWRDEVAGWQAEVEALDGWTVQKSDEAHVRWFAIHPDSTTVQWTTELRNPLGPKFGTAPYLEALKEVFEASMQTEGAPFVEVKAGVVDPLVELEVVGRVEGRSQALRLWQWQRGDVLVTFSVQGPEESFGERLVEAEAVMGTLTSYGTAYGEKRPKRREHVEGDEQILEFQFEEHYRFDEN